MTGISESAALACNTWFEKVKDRDPANVDWGGAAVSIRRLMRGARPTRKDEKFILDFVLATRKVSERHWR